ncbi:MAG TPA: SLBB domain-containing protein [Balneolales bacterium]|nr:SLBB domain-containing protein [Balneolales bacterium]
MNNKSKLTSLFKGLTSLSLAVVFVLNGVSTVKAQNDNNQNSQTNPQNNMNLNFGEGANLYNYYYLDQIGLEMARNKYPQEGYINADTYKLGPQDMLTVDLHGAITMSMRAIVVNPEGDIILPSVGQINVKNLTLKEAEEKIRKVFKENYKETKVLVSLDKPRNITIHVTGDVPYPGKYIVPAQTRVDQAIFSSLYGKGSNNPDNPDNRIYNAHTLSKERVSLRNITIDSDNHNKKHADLIAYFKAGDLKADPFVHNGDVITINKIMESSPQISISGAVNAPINMEYKQGDTISGLIAIAGGFTNSADSTRAIIYRPQPDSIQKIIVTQNDDSYSDNELKPNDRVVIPYSSTRTSTYSAWVYGEANAPGNFPIIEGKTTAYDLIKMAGGLANDALPKAAYLIRNKPSIRNMPSTAGFNKAELQRTSDQTDQGLKYLQLETKLDKNEVYVDLSDPSQLKKVKIYDGDKLFIPRNEHTVYVMGQVDNPGYYDYKSDLNASDYVKDAGGFTIAANPERVFVIKAGSKSWYKPGQTTIQSGDIVFVDRVPYEDLNLKRNYEIQKKNVTNARISLILSAISTTVLLLNFVKFKL